jgi:hypothetical protein
MFRVCNIGSLCMWLSLNNVFYWWWMQYMCMANGSFRGVLQSSIGIVGSLYVMESASKWIIVCVSWKGPLRGVKFWYQCVSGITEIVRLCGLFCVANLAQCILCCASLIVWGCANPVPCHLYWKAVSKDPKITSLWKDEKRDDMVVEQVTGDEKYECVMLNVVWRNLSIWWGSV